MSEPFLGEIKMFGGNFAPRGFALCQGQILSIAQNTALFSILGTTYGGNGQTTFALPNLSGRVPVGTGTGPGLTPRDLGEVGGTENTTLTQLQMPMHTHVATGTASISVGGTPVNPALAPTATNNILGASVGGSAQAASIWSSALETPVTMGNQSSVAVTVQTAGGSQPFSILNPYLGISFIIALEGIFPSRN
ncbi:phage tail protein [Pseudomonas sp. D(2018)]|uniref:phage tail protein n=1 Tax=Pseudomonas sp. D(2018) TaxID=2502238 RepID=UPI0010F7D715|nr:tail fiber protein [Pseudomonas sp. D(2018)]